MIQLNYENVNTFGYRSHFKIGKTVENNIDKLIYEYENITNYGFLECPYCNGTEFTNYCTYERHIVIGEIYKTINIQRVECKTCHKTHALIPPFIKPYFQNESSFIDFTIILIKVRNKKNTEIERRLLLSRQLLRHWKKRYEKHKTYLTTTIEDDIKEIFTRTFKEKYYEENHIVYFAKSVCCTYYTK